MAVVMKWQMEGVKGESIGMCGCRVIIIAYGSVQKLRVQVNLITLFSYGRNFIIFQSQTGLNLIVNTKIGFEKALLIWDLGALDLREWIVKYFVSTDQTLLL